VAFFYLGVRFTHGWYNDFFFPPLIRCSLRSRLCLCSAKFHRMGSAYRLHRRTCYTKKEPPRRISEVLKVAATYFPTTQCSTIGDAVSLCCPRPSPLRSLPPPQSPASARFRSLSRSRSLSRARALSRAPQARTAHTPLGAHRTP